MLNVQNADVYTDFNGLAKLKNEARKNSPEAIKEVAKQFESIFLSKVLKSMRQAKLSDGIFDSDQSKFYQDMYDQQLALHLSGKPGLGLADLIARQLTPKVADPQNKMELEDYLKRSAVVAVNIIKTKKTVAAPERNIEKGSARASKNLSERPVDRPITGKEQFIKRLQPFARQAAFELGVDPNVLLSQAALETGWGKAVIKKSNGDSSFNLFNIKADKSWQGPQTRKSALEFESGIGRKKMAAFRAYDSYQSSFKDYVNFIKNNPRYANAIKMASNPERYMRELQQAGYATDPAYADKVMRIYHTKFGNSKPVVVASK